MIVIPAVDIRGGMAVRLVRGRYDRESLRAGSALDAALRWAALGPARLHVVDLDGAREGRPANSSVVREIIARARVPVEVGGGVRTAGDAAGHLDAGAARVVLGTRAAEDPEFVRSLARRWPGRVNLGLDVSGGLVAVRGWTEASRLTALELLSRLEGAPLGEVIHTDVSRDGTLAGPDLESLVALAGRSPWPVIASGGVASVEDLERLAALGVFGAIVGRALYTGEVDLADAISRIEGRPAPPSE